MKINKKIYRLAVLTKLRGNYMVKLTFWEEFSIEIVIAVIVYFLIRNYIDTTSWALWVWIVVLVVYFGISNIVVKLIKRKEVLDEEERIKKEKEKKSAERMDKAFSSVGKWASKPNWANKSFSSRKLLWIILIIIGLVIIASILIALFLA